MGHDFIPIFASVILIMQLWALLLLSISSPHDELQILLHPQMGHHHVSRHAEYCQSVSILNGANTGPWNRCCK